MKLYFLRHGEAGDPAQWEGNDAERPLTDDGRRRMALEARTMRRLELGVDRVITSPLLRARQTAEIVAVELKRKDRVVTDSRLGPDFGPERLAEILRDNQDVHDLMLVGHEPSMSATIGRLIGGGRVELKKGGLARTDVPNPAQLSGELEWLLPPRALLADERR
ncbi:MAG: phosphohistidine phosphatase, SixA [Candidatus Eremiobacteraeota bacterium]|nr:phosphohistidine phosphatase, SixA [Candidatus Eremiobacteraeota bacterium]